MGTKAEVKRRKKRAAAKLHISPDRCEVMLGWRQRVWTWRAWGRWETPKYVVPRLVVGDPDVWLDTPKWALRLK